MIDVNPSSDGFLDCCAEPRPEASRLLYESTHDQEALLRCASCSAWWFYRFNERVDWLAGDDDLTSWWSRLSDDEATSLVGAPLRADIDLSFLRERPSWLDDRAGPRKVTGAPEHPAS